MSNYAPHFIVFAFVYIILCLYKYMYMHACTYMYMYTVRLTGHLWFQLRVLIIAMKPIGTHTNIDTHFTLLLWVHTCITCSEIIGCSWCNTKGLCGVSGPSLLMDSTPTLCYGVVSRRSPVTASSHSIMGGGCWCVQMSMDVQSCICEATVVGRSLVLGMYMYSYV